MRITFLFSFLILLAACSSKKNATGNSGGTKTNLHISLTAENLSEDLSKLATQNDEIVLLVYAVNKDSAQTPPILCEYCIFDSLQMKYDLVSDSIASSFKGDLAFVLVEMDDDEAKEQVEIVVTPNLSKISKAYNDKDVATLTDYLGDNDLLGIEFVGSGTIHSKKQKPIIISGVHTMDSYKYILTFK